MNIFGSSATCVGLNPCMECTQALRVATSFCIAGWLAIYFAQVCVILISEAKGIFFPPDILSHFLLPSQLIQNRGFWRWTSGDWQQVMEWESFLMW